MVDTFSPIDLSQLPAPTIVETLDFETLLTARKERLISLYPAAERAGSHLTPAKLRSKIVAGVIDLPLVRIENSQKAAQGVHLANLARYLDLQRERAVRENDKLHNRAS